MFVDINEKHHVFLFVAAFPDEVTDFQDELSPGWTQTEPISPHLI